MLALLAFKKSLFAGVLDGGKSDIHLGGSRLTRFMEGVQRATAPPVPEAASAAPPAPEPPAAQLTNGSAAEASVVATPEGNPWQPLLALGQALLQEITGAPDADASGRATGLVQLDPETGERYLRLPVPEPDAVARLTEALRDVLGAIR